MNYRVAGVIIKNNRILLHRSEIDDFWALPGGSIKFMETYEKAIKREFKEELNIKIEVGRLLWVLENYFEYQNEKIHSIEFYFLITPLDSEEKLSSEEFFGKEEHFYHEKYGQLKLIFKWFSLNELAEIDLRPKILKQELKSIQPYPKLIRNKDL
ncbi:MAG TPA: NUDIX hydrolase [Candidatus Bathyarchaeia archaeon]|nr:NUDIX hydrolase [Candidatus Bathyarchaeia archaeon]